MAEGLILEFEGVGREQYDAVNAVLGLDPDAGSGDWPEGLLFHGSGAKPGGWVVFELWESREAQERFMGSRLGAALAQGGVDGPPSRVEWLPDGSHHAPGL